MNNWVASGHGLKVQETVVSGEKFTNFFLMFKGQLIG